MTTLPEIVPEPLWPLIWAAAGSLLILFSVGCVVIATVAVCIMRAVLRGIRGSAPGSRPVGWDPRQEDFR